MIPKFRAWHEPTKKMWPVLEIDFENEVITVARGEKEETCSCCWENDKWFKIKDIILMESTGLQDKSDKGMFLGDIIEWQLNNGCIPLKGELKISKTVGPCKEGLDLIGHYAIGDNRNTWHQEDLTQMQVIGNIYENPELL